MHSPFPNTPALTRDDSHKPFLCIYIDNSKSQNLYNSCHVPRFVPASCINAKSLSLIVNQ